MMSPLEIVLVAVMLGFNPNSGSYELTYSPINYYRSNVECSNERNRLQKKPDKKITYLCLKVSYD